MAKAYIWSRRNLILIGFRDWLYLNRLLPVEKGGRNNESFILSFSKHIQKTCSTNNWSSTAPYPRYLYSVARPRVASHGWSIIQRDQKMIIAEADRRLLVEMVESI